MGIVFRQAIKTSIVNGCGVLLGALTIWLTSHLLSQGELGGNRFLTYQAVVLQFFLLLGVAHTVFAFRQRFIENIHQQRALLTIGFITPIITTLIFCLPYYIFKEVIISKFQIENRPFMRAFYSWLPLYGLLYGIMTLLEYYLYACYKSAVATFMREVLLRLCNLAVLGAFYLRWINFNQFIEGTILVTIVPIILLIFIASRTAGFGLTLKWSTFSSSLKREMARYAWYHLLTGASLNLLPYLDSLLLGPLSGLRDVALYTNAQFIAGVLIFAYKAMGTAAIPDINEAYIKKDSVRLAELYGRSSLNTQIVAAATWLIIICNLPNIAAILPKNYIEVAPLVLILSLGKMADMFTGLNAELLSISRHYKASLWITILQVIIVVTLDRIIIPVYGVYGAAWIASIAIMVFNIIKAFYLYNKEGLQPIYKGTWKIIIATLILYIINSIIPATGQYFIIDTIIRILILMGLFVGLMLFLKPSPDLNNYILQIKERKRLF